MNLYAPDEASSGPTTSRGRRCSPQPAPPSTIPSFNGHAYTCDGQQVPDLPALCAPQEILVEHKDGDAVAS